VEVEVGQMEHNREKYYTYYWCSKQTFMQRYDRMDTCTVQEKIWYSLLSFFGNTSPFIWLCLYNSDTLQYYTTVYTLP
jgi:hypothetical protein